MEIITGIAAISLVLGFFIGVVVYAAANDRF
jgi:hypothetical protein